MARSLVLSLCLQGLGLVLGLEEELPFTWNSLQVALRGVARDKAKTYNCSVAIAARDGKGHSWSVAGGVADFTSGALAEAGDPFVLGSITKTFTGPAALQLVEKGVWHLDEPFAPLVDPVLKAAGRPGLAEKFGRAAADITLRQLLHMTAGVPDYDTSWDAGDPWRFRQYDQPKHNFGPLEIYDALPGNLTFAPGTQQSYCSSNYVLIGLALAHQAGAAQWQDYDQMTVVPSKLREKGELSELRFALAGPCSRYTREHGYDRMGPPVRPTEPGMHDGKDVSDVSCLGGWTAGNAIAPVSAVAAWTEALFSKEAEVVSPAMQKIMKNTTVPAGGHGPSQFYGVAAFNLSKTSGLAWPQGEAWGHLGSTYGYQSISAYFPATGATVVVATNLEIRQQDAPSDALCSAYNYLLSHQQKRRFPKCRYTRSGYFFGVCDCSAKEEPANLAAEFVVSQQTEGKGPGWLDVATQVMV